MKVLVTGAAGLTGSAVATELVRRGHDVVGVVRRPEQAGLVAAGIRAAVADCDDPEAVDRAVEGTDAVVHVAGITVWRGLAGARGLGGPRSVVVVSSAGVYSRHRASAAAYRRGEDELRLRRPDAVIVRPTMIYGSPRDRNVHDVIRIARRYGVLPLIGPGDRRIQPIHYQDLAAAIATLVGSASSTVLDAGGGAPISLRGVAEAIFAALRRPVRLVPIPTSVALAAAGALDALRGSRWRERVERMSEDRSVDNGPLVAATGVAPRDFAAGVREEVAEMYPAGT